MSIFNSFFYVYQSVPLTLSRAALTMRGEEEAMRKRKPGAETCDFLYHRFFIMGPLMSTATLFCYDWKIQITMCIYIYLYISEYMRYITRRYVITVAVIVLLRNSRIEHVNAANSASSPDQLADTLQPQELELFGFHLFSKMGDVNNGTSWELTLMLYECVYIYVYMYIYIYMYGGFRFVIGVPQKSSMK